MSALEYNLIVEPADRISEIAVYDGFLNVVAKGVGHAQWKLASGLYRVRIRVGSATDEKVIALDQDRTVSFDPLAFASPIPLRVCEKARSYHMTAAAAAAGLKSKRDLGKGASIMVFVREWSVQGNASGGNPAQGLSLLDSQENLLADIWKEAELRSDGDASAGWREDVAPGGYFLRLELGDADQTVLLRPLYVSSGHQLQIFFLVSDHIVDDGNLRKTIRRPDLANAAIVISTNGSFDPDDRHIRSSQLACSALTESREVLLPAVIEELADENYDNPMLDLFAAHLLLTWRRDDKALFKKLTDKLLAMLGEDHPDLQALWWQRGPDQTIADGRLHLLPMLRASWSLAVNRSIKTLDVLSLGTFASKLPRIIPSTPWLMLMDNEWAVSDAAIDDYMKARAHAQTTRAEAKSALEAEAYRKQYFKRAYSAVRDLLPTNLASYLPDVTAKPITKEAPGGESQLETPAALPGSPAAPLQGDEKAELARTLALPANILDEILKRKGH
jgi:hypothetical protein